MKKLIISLVFSFLFSYAHAQIITTIAGSDSFMLGDGGPATSARLSHPVGITKDAVGNLYICDRDYNLIRKVDQFGIITTIAGTGTAGFDGDNGPATAARLNVPLGIAVDNIGNIYFSDVYNNRIRKIDTFGIITTIAGTGDVGYNGDNIPATAAQLNYPHGITLDAGNNVYISDFANNRVRKVSASGIITTIAGDGTAAFSGDNGPATIAQIHRPYGITMDDADNIYVVDFANHRVRKINTAGIIATIAGGDTTGYSGDNGPATAALLDPVGIAINAYGDIYVADAYNSVVRKIDNEGIIHTFAGIGLNGYTGDGGPANMARLFDPTGVAVDDGGNLYIADFGNNRIRYIRSTIFVNTLIAPSIAMHTYPNPCNGRFIFNASSPVNEVVGVTISDMAGVKVKEITMITNSPQNIQLDVSTGIYLISVSSARDAITGKIQISR